MTTHDNGLAYSRSWMGESTGHRDAGRVIGHHFTAYTCSGTALSPQSRIIGDAKVRARFPPATIQFPYSTQEERGIRWVDRGRRVSKLGFYIRRPGGVHVRLGIAVIGPRDSRLVWASPTILWCVKHILWHRDTELGIRIVNELGFGRVALLLGTSTIASVD